MLCTVPPGAAPGTSFQIQVPAPQAAPVMHQASAVPVMAQAQAQPVMAQAQAMPVMAQAQAQPMMQTQVGMNKIQQPGMMMAAQPGMAMAPNAPPQNKQQVLDAIARAGCFTIVQQVNLWEAVTGGCFEAPNAYIVSNTHTGQPIMAIMERSDKMCRCCCAPNQPLFLEFVLINPMTGKPNHPGGGELMQPDPNSMWTMERPGLCEKFTVCCNCSETYRDEMTLHDGAIQAGIKPGLVPSGTTQVVGSAVEAPCCGESSGCTPTIHIFQGDRKQPGAQPIAAIEGPMIFGGCSELCCKSTFPVSRLTQGAQGPWPKKVGDIATFQKQAPSNFTEACKEAATDSDKYILEIHDATLPIEQRVNLLASIMLADFMFFEQDHGMCSSGDGGQGIKITCFECYCYGCLCPCNLNSGSGDSSAH
jgi:hypothetical protein